MSAFIVNHEHIDRLLATAEHGPANYRAPGGWSFHLYLGEYLGAADAGDPGLNLDTLGILLAEENERSVNYRYQNSTPTESYQRNPRARRLTMAETFKALDCYEYQSCEHPGWKDSRAREFCLDLRKAVGKAAPGYEDAPWEHVPERVTA